MKILYVAKHGSGGNDDEGAVAHALRALGHEVDCVREGDFRHAFPRQSFDFLLCHHWHDLDSLRGVAAPKVFWCFDLVMYPDPTLEPRNVRRGAWVRAMAEACDLGFMTDGDHVARDTTGKLHWLPQGADERVAGFGQAAADGGAPPILFTGIAQGGEGRASFVEGMKARWGEKFNHVPRGVYGRGLANLIAASAIVVAPDHPVTNRYWSNRVWNALGFGAFMLHPYCEELTGHYGDGEEIVYYADRAELHRQVAHYLEHPEERRRMAEAALARTLREHTYRHRVEKLVATVKERLGV